MEAEDSAVALPSLEKMSKTRTVVGVDIGRRNLAVAIVSGPPVGSGPATIHSLHLMDVGGASMAGTIHRMHSRVIPMAKTTIDEWAIEQQPYSNATMYCVAHSLYAILHTHYPKPGPNIRMQAPQRRFTALPPSVLTKEEYATENKTYYRRKKLATTVVGRLLDSGQLVWAEDTEHGRASAALAGESAVKADDLADAILHALAAL